MALRIPACDEPHHCNEKRLGNCDVQCVLRDQRADGSIGARECTLVIKGDRVVDIDPPGRNLLLYRRDHFRSAEPRYIEVERFLSDDAVDY